MLAVCKRSSKVMKVVQGTCHRGLSSLPNDLGMCWPKLCLGLNFMGSEMRDRMGLGGQASLTAKIWA